MEHLTPKQVARAIGVSDASLKRWCDRGVVPSIRTAGGHRRIPLAGVIEYLRVSGRALIRPEILGLPPTTGAGRTVASRSIAQMSDSLACGDEQQFQRILFDLTLSGHSLLEICDRMLAPAFHELGTRWEHGLIEVYQERRACEIGARSLHRLAAVLHPPAPDAALAIGTTPVGDPYSIPTLMVELALREAGWRAESLGTQLPAAALRAAIRDLRPRLVWLSASWLADVDEFVREYDETYRVASTAGTAIVVGGRQFTENVRSRMRYAAYCDNLTHLVAFAGALR